MRKLYRILICCAIGLVGLYFLYQASPILGGCSNHSRKLSDKDLIAEAIRINLSVHGPGSSRTKNYSSVEDVVHQNPNCCEINSGTSHVSSLLELGASDLVTVKVVYLIEDKNNTRYESFVVLNKCGKYFERFGTTIE